MNARRSLVTIVVLAALVGCSRSRVADSDVDASSAPAPPASSSASSSSSNGGGDAGSPAALSDAAFRALSTRLSEPDRPFFSDNYVSNETSYLHVAGALARQPSANEVYLGVGPEQTFSYIALVRPKLAFVVDIRRENMILHLLYKAAFTLATSRAHFVALLVGRPYDAATCPSPAATIDDVIRHAEKLAPTEASYATAHDALTKSIASTWGPLDAADQKSFDAAHRAFFQKQLDLSFELKEKNGRAYPRLRQLLAETDRAGTKRGFLATDDDFRFVATLERENRVVPFVGDLAGDHALPALAKYLTDERLVVTTLYVSNVEQYLFTGQKLATWAENVAALPTEPKTVIVRAYLDQGKKHPRAVEGHRTVTLLQYANEFTTREATKPYATFWELVNEPEAATTR